MDSLSFPQFVNNREKNIKKNPFRVLWAIVSEGVL